MFFTAASQTFPSGDRAVYGGKGEVVGPGDADDTVSVLFEGNGGNIDCFVTELSRTAPPSI